MSIAALLDTYYLNEEFLSLLKSRRSELNEEKEVHLQPHDHLAKILSNEKFYTFMPGFAPPLSLLSFDQIIDSEGYLFPTDRIEIKIYFENYLLEKKELYLSQFYDFYTQIKTPHSNALKVTYKIIPQEENDYIKHLENVNEPLVLQILSQVPSCITKNHQEYLIMTQEMKDKKVMECVQYLSQVLQKESNDGSPFFLYHLNEFSRTHDIYYLLKMLSRKNRFYNSFKPFKWWFKFLLRS